MRTQLARIFSTTLVAAIFSLLQARAEESSSTVSPSATESKAPVESGHGGLPEDFLGLADLRASLNAEIASLESDIKVLEESTIPRALELQQTVSELNTRIATLEKQAQRSKEAEQLLGNLKEKRDYYTPKADVLSLRASLVANKATLATKKDLAKKVQTKISSFLSPEQKFKLTMSITFAGLIACVIIGFFLISFYDDKIRQAIFSGESGIQFLTLFSLVIAIILFGITGILEGKELAALLGGLSGYILGRVTPKAA